jgi:hypothetical protein
MPNKLALPEQAASFIETMDCLPVSKLPDGPEWTYERKPGDRKPGDRQETR